MDQIVTIMVHNINDFIQEARKRELDTVYCTVEDTLFVYSVFDFRQRVMLKGSIEVEIVKVLQSMDMTSGYGRYHRAWHFNGDVVEADPSSKRRFTKALKQLGVNKDTVKQFNTVSVEDLSKLIDESDEEADVLTTFRKHGKIEHKLECDFMGKVKEVFIVIKGSSGSLDYKLEIRGWVEIMDSLRKEYEAVFNDSGIRIISGSIHH